MTDLSVAADGIVLTTDPGTMRLILQQARVSCQSIAMAPNVSTDLKGRWGNRASFLGELEAQLPPPADPREPYGSASTKEQITVVTTPSSFDLDDLLA